MMFWRIIIVFLFLFSFKNAGYCEISIPNDLILEADLAEVSLNSQKISFKGNIIIKSSEMNMQTDFLDIYYTGNINGSDAKIEKIISTVENGKDINIDYKDINNHYIVKCKKLIIDEKNITIFDGTVDEQKTVMSGKKISYDIKNKTVQATSKVKIIIK